jgi:IclR family transcriptional regulator, KDG regulon repressor
MVNEKEEKKVKQGASYVVSSVDRAIEILLTLAERPDSGVTELAEATGNTKSLTFRLLHTLERRGMVRKDPERRSYTLGYRALLLGDQSRCQSRLASTAEPILANLSAATRENALLLVREELQSICIAMHASPERLRIFAAVGRLGPLHAGGGPKVLLAWAPCEVREKVISSTLETYTEMSISDAETLETRLQDIRESGYAVSVGELDPNIFSIAAPVHDHTGVVVAALGVNGPTARLNDDVQDNIRATVLLNADRLSRMLGWHGESAISGG